MAWKLTQCDANDKDRLNLFLGESWEPFAVTETDHVATIWLRRSAEPKDARFTPMPRRRLDEMA